MFGQTSGRTFARCRCTQTHRALLAIIALGKPPPSTVKHILVIEPGFPSPNDQYVLPTELGKPKINDQYVLVINLGLLKLDGQHKLVIEWGEAALDGYNAPVINLRRLRTQRQWPAPGHQAREALA